MHELHLITDLLSDLLKHVNDNHAKKVTKIFLRMGEFTEINEENIRFLLKEKSAGTMLEGAEVAIEKSPTRELRLLSYDCE